MKTPIKICFFFFLFLVAGFILTGCSVSTGSIHHGIMTQVQLREANYEVLGSVTGHARSNYVLGMNLARQNLFGRAKMDMVENADLSRSQAFINFTTDVRDSEFIIWRQRTVYVSAEVIEFISDDIENNAREEVDEEVEEDDSGQIIDSDIEERNSEDIE